MVILATKNISETLNGYGVIIAIHKENEKWIASFEEDENHNLLVDAPIKVMHKVGEHKKVLTSYREYNLTNDIIKTLDKVLEMFNNSPIETKRVLAF